MLRLRFERTNRRVSQAVLAHAAGLHQPVLSAIERGRLVPSRDELQRLAAALRVDPDELLKDVAVLGPSR